MGAPGQFTRDTWVKPGRLCPPAFSDLTGSCLLVCPGSCCLADQALEKKWLFQAWTWARNGYFAPLPGSFPGWANMDSGLRWPWRLLLSPLTRGASGCRRCYGGPCPVLLLTPQSLLRAGVNERH